MSASEKSKIPQKIKYQFISPTIIILENGDIIAVQTAASNVVRIVGQKDANGFQHYDVELTHAVGRPEAEMLRRRQELKHGQETNIDTVAASD